MKHLAFALAICILAAGCGGAMYKSSYDAAYGEAPAQAGPGAGGGAYQSEEGMVMEASSYRGDEHDYYGDMDGIPDADDDRGSQGENLSRSTHWFVSIDR